MAKSKGAMMQSKRPGKQKNNRRVTTNRILGLPNRYPMAFGDATIVKAKSTVILTAPNTSPFIKTGLIVLGKGTSITGYDFYSGLSSLFDAMSGCYSKFMISDLEVEVRASGVGGSANTFIACSYIPSDSHTENPPTTLGELSQAAHYAESTLGTVGRLRVSPCDYYNDWRNVNDTDDGDKQAGLVQFYGSGSSAEVTIGLITITATVHFCGLRA